MRVSKINLWLLTYNNIEVPLRHYFTSSFSHHLKDDKSNLLLLGSVKKLNIIYVNAYTVYKVIEPLGIIPYRCLSSRHVVSKIH
jgi:hypothetical protein